MSSFIDRTGQQFGKWTLLSYEGNKRYQCQCECGTIKSLSTSSLTRGHTHSCGCSHPNKIDLTGNKYGRWSVLSYWGKKNNKQYWNCRCECGTERTVWGGQLRNNSSVSCGCHHKELISSHNLSQSSEYRCWTAMKQRCHNPDNPTYPYYGGRGISVCEEWKNDFMAFYNHVGPKPSPELSLDRIENDGNYEPGNVRWATSIVQANNQRPKRKQKGSSGTCFHT